MPARKVFNVCSVNETDASYSKTIFYVTSGVSARGKRFDYYGEAFIASLTGQTNQFFEDSIIKGLKFSNRSIFTS